LLAEARRTLAKASLVVSQTIQLAEFLEKQGIHPDGDKPFAKESELRQQAAIQFAPELGEKLALMRGQIWKLEVQRDASAAREIRIKEQSRKLQTEKHEALRRLRQHREETKLLRRELASRTAQVKDLREESRALRREVAFLSRRSRASENAEVA
jgi:hypothetical protein